MTQRQGFRLTSNVPASARFGNPSSSAAQISGGTAPQLNHGFFCAAQERDSFTLSRSSALSGVLFWLIDPAGGAEVLMDGRGASFGRRMAPVVILLVVIAGYSYPYLATTRTLRSRLVPYSFAADPSLYLNLGQLGSPGHQSTLNPYYGTPMPSGVFGYLTFDLAFRVFGWVENLVNHNLWDAVLIWNWLWWTAIFVGAFWFLRLALPHDRSPVLWLGMSLVFFFNFGILKSLMGAWLHLPSLAGFEALSLPYIRSFFPPIPVALLLFYLAVQIRALRFSNWYDWAVMGVLQAVTLATFPYATLMMAGSTLVVALPCFRSILPYGRLKAVIPYGLGCAAIDIMLLLHSVKPGMRDSQFSFFRFRPLHVFDLAGGSVILLFLLTIITIVLPPSGSREAKWSLAGLGFSNVLLMLGDAVLAPSLLMSTHGSYFLHCTVSLQVTYVIAALFARFERMYAWLRPACLAAIFLVTVNGAMLSLGNYRAFLPQNREISEFARAVNSLQVDDRDLFLARADTVDDLCSWVPLLNRGTVLFCRSAQYELSDSERRSAHRLRQAFYLYFTGKDSRWVEGVVRNPEALTAQDRLAFAGEINPSDKDTLDTGRREITSELIPQLHRVEQSQDQAQKFFHSFPQILVIDDARHPVFVRQRLASYFSIDSEQRVGDFVVLRCRVN
ncbi:MAG: hypothetical protein ACRD20_15665 [Terriglobales bacterium]